ncbi:MAG: acyl-CoA synthetase, partial [Solirubrobacteraceae bacterium]
MDLLPKTITRPIGRLGAAAQNALEVARFGGLDTDEQPSHFEFFAEHRVYQLRRYYRRSGGNGEAAAREKETAGPGGADGDGRAGAGPAVLLVPPMMLAVEIYDVSPATSAVTRLHQNGVDPWVVDFGAPEREEGGLE